MKLHICDYCVVGKYIVYQLSTNYGHLFIFSTNFFCMP